MNNYLIRNTSAVGTSIVAIAALLGGCGVDPPPPLTIAVSATSAEPAPAIHSLRNMLIDRAADSLMPGDGAVQVVIQGQPGAATIDLTPMRGDDVEANYAKITEKIHQKLPALKHTIERAAATSDGLDVLGVLDQAIEATPAGGDIVMVTSGFSTVDPVDLTMAGDWLQDPQGFVDQIDPRNIPNAEGRRITWIGLGYAAPNSKQQSAGPAARKALQQLWTAVCRAANAASCDVVTVPASTIDPAATNQVPLVALDQLTTHCIGTSTIDAGIAFARDSATLTTNADKILQPIADALSDCPDGRQVDAVGHTAEVPGGGNGLGLPAARAEAVMTRLRHLGAPARVLGKATGVGSVRDQLVDNTPGGDYDERLAAQNRVVELIARN